MKHKKHFTFLFAGSVGSLIGWEQGLAAYYFEFDKLSPENSNIDDVSDYTRFSMGQHLESVNHLTDLQAFSYSRKIDEINPPHSASVFFPN